jgi:hypothetical protein
MVLELMVCCIEFYGDEVAEEWMVEGEEKQ